MQAQFDELVSRTSEFELLLASSHGGWGSDAHGQVFRALVAADRFELSRYREVCVRLASLLLPDYQSALLEQPYRRVFWSHVLEAATRRLPVANVRAPLAGASA